MLFVKPHAEFSSYYFEIIRKNITNLNVKERPCWENDDTSLSLGLAKSNGTTKTIDQCILDFYHSKLGCQLPWSKFHTRNVISQMISSARFKIWTRSILISALLHRTRIFQCDCKGHRPKQFLDILRRCANPRNSIFFHFCVVKMTLCSEFFKFKDMQQQN